MQPLVAMSGIFKAFSGVLALSAASLEIASGEVHGLIGQNGAGKSTMMDVITGKIRPDAGSAWFGRNIDLLVLREPEIAAAGIGRKFQKPSVFEQLTVFENLELALAAVAQQACGALGHVGQARARRHLAGHLVAVHEAARRLPPQPGLLRAGLGGEAAVLVHGEARVDGGALVAAAQALLRAPGLRPVRHVHAHQLHLAAAAVDADRLEEA